MLNYFSYNLETLVKFMENKTPLKLQIDFVFVSKRIKILAIGIIISIIFVFAMGLTVSYANIRPDMYNLNILSIIICLVVGAASLPIKKLMVKKATPENFLSVYFNAHIIPLLLCDLGGLLCVSTNLFINQNIILAAGGVVISAIYIILIFPYKKDLDKITAK